MKWFKGVLVLLCCVGPFNFVGAQPPPRLEITEIMYNPLGLGSDSLDFIEFSSEGGAYYVSQWGPYFSSGIEFEFPSDLVVGWDDYIIVAKDSVAFENTFGIPAYQWSSSSSLNDVRDTLVILGANTMGHPVNDSIIYSNSQPWPTGANGLGKSLVKCAPVFANSMDPSNWQTSQNNTGIVVNGITIYADPGEASYCTTVGVEEVIAPATIQAFPNPTNNQVQIDLGSTLEITTIATYNALGELVQKEKQMATGLIDYVLPNPKGVYLIQLVHTDGNTTNLKVVKE